MTVSSAEWRQKMADGISTHKFKINRKGKIVICIAAVLLICLTGLIGIAVQKSHRSDDHREEAKRAFIEYLTPETIEWRNGENVSTEDLDFCFIDYSDECPPIMYISRRKDCALVFYDTNTRECRTLYPDMEEYSYLQGYIPTDNGMLLVFTGFRSHIETEEIILFENCSIRALAEKTDYYPLLSDRTDESNPLEDVYIWDGTPVSISEYYFRHGHLIDGTFDCQLIRRASCDTFS